MVIVKISTVFSPSSVNINRIHAVVNADIFPAKVLQHVLCALYVMMSFCVYDSGLVETKYSTVHTSVGVAELCTNVKQETQKHNLHY